MLPPIVFVAPEKVCTPVLAVYEPLLVKLPAKPTTAAPFSVNVPVMVTSEPNDSCAATVSDNVAPAAIVTAPVNVFVPVALVNVRVPLVPPPIVVAPVTVNGNAPPTLNVGPFPKIKVPVTVFPAVA